MFRQVRVQDRLHVLYLGSSADLGALRRSLEARGAVTRTRLTPEVAVVVADSSVETGHPTLHAAATLGVRVLDPDEAIDQLPGWSTRPDPNPGHAGLSPPGAPVIAGTIAALVTVLAVLAVLGAVLRTDEVSQRIQLPTGTSLPVLAPGHLGPN